MSVNPQAYVAKFLETFKEFPPTASASLSVDSVLNQLKASVNRQ
jgi:hypothetical protein